MVQSPRRLRADWVTPISESPIWKGEVILEQGRILEVREAKGPPDATTRDFGPAILLPGLVNTHTHVEYTVLRGLLEDEPFFPWIRKLTLSKALVQPEDWIASATLGAAEALAAGITTIADCTDSGAAAPAAIRLGLRGVLYQELFGIDPSVSNDEALKALDSRVRALSAQVSGSPLQVGISPHAPYTVRPELIQAAARYAAERRMPVAIHAAESQAESTLLRHGRGEFADMFRRRGITWTTPERSTLTYLSQLGALGPRTLLVHGVQISSDDARLARSSGSSWAHCPISNAKLANGVAPLELLLENPDASPEHGLAREPRVGLGTDSVVSNNRIDILEEMRFAILMHRAARRRIPALGARQALELATLGGARALHMEELVGSLAPGKQADLCVVAADAPHAVPVYDPHSALAYSSRGADVVCTVVGGGVRYDKSLSDRPWERYPGEDLSREFRLVADAARRLALWKEDSQ